jgi:hypothetical protein
MPRNQTQEAAGPAEVAPKEEKKALEFKPYAGSESLPKYEIISRGVPTKGIPPRIKYGEPRFIVARGERNTFKVLAFYASPRGIVRKVWGVLKPTAQRPKDQAILAKLKAAQIPGAF